MHEINYWAVLAAGVANIVVSFSWYHPRFFGKSWMAEANMSPAQVEQGKASMRRNIFLALAAGVVAAYVLNYFGIAWGVYDVLGAIELGFWAWLGFTAVPMLGMVLWEQKSLRYYAIVSGGWLVSFIVMSLVLLI